MDSLPLPRGRLARLLRSRFGSLYIFGLVLMAISLALRTALAVHCRELADPHVLTTAMGFLTGLAFDLAATGFCLLPAALVLLFVGDGLLHRRWVRVLAMAAYAVGVYLALYEAAVEWYFWDEFASRFNLVAVEHLGNTEEVVGNIQSSYPVLKVSLGLLAAAVVIVAVTARAVNRSYLAATAFRARLRGALPFLLLPLLVLPALGQRMSRLFTNDYTNALAQNGPICFMRTFINRTPVYRENYVTRDEGRVLADLRTLLAADNAVYTSKVPGNVTRRINGGGPDKEKKFNVVILTIESLSAHYLGAFGNTKGLTPNLDALAGKGLLLRNLYATGTRTIRGLEAITLSLPPTPGLAVVKRPGANRLFSLEHLLKTKGYSAKFIYGGRGRFDSMNSFLGQDGFEMIDQTNLGPSEISFVTEWGVCDEDLYRRVIQECRKSYRPDKNFFVMSMSVSNHVPFEYPQTIDIPSGKGVKGKYLAMEGAVKYSDYALGQFFRQAEKEPWFANTIFLVVADHCARKLAPKEISPVKYHIPAIFYCPALIPAPAVNDDLCSQIDLAPTILGMLNMSYTTKFFGRDIFKSPPHRALVSTPSELALMTNDKLLILEPNRTASTYRLHADEDETLTDMDEALLNRAITYYQGAAYVLDHNLYRKR